MHFGKKSQIFLNGMTNYKNNIVCGVLLNCQCYEQNSLYGLVMMILLSQISLMNLVLISTLKKVLQNNFV